MAKGKSTGARGSERRGLELALLWPEEDKGALLARVRLRNIKLEDCAVVLVDAGVILGSV